MAKNKRAKGLEFQRWIKKWLEEKDWIVHNQVPVGKLIVVKGKKIFISQRNDIFGCDLIARKDFKNNLNFSMVTLWIQATLDSGITRKVEELKKFPWGRSLGDRVQVWLKTAKGDINIKELVIIFNQDLMKSIFEVKDLGKIIRRKFYACEGMSFEF